MVIIVKLNEDSCDRRDDLVVLLVSYNGDSLEMVRNYFRENIADIRSYFAGSDGMSMYERENQIRELFNVKCVIGVPFVVAD